MSEEAKEEKKYTQEQYSTLTMGIVEASAALEPVGRAIDHIAQYFNLDLNSLEKGDQLRLVAEYKSLYSILMLVQKSVEDAETVLNKLY